MMPWTGPKVSFSHESPLWRQKFPGAERLAKRAAAAAFRAAGAKARRAEVSILLTNDQRVRKLNREYRAKDKPTNVLSFPTGDEKILGDIAVAYGVMAREAKSEGKSLEAHFAHLVAHGTLHLLGFDHMKDIDADEMEFFEKKVMEGLGFENPYR